MTRNLQSGIYPSRKNPGRSFGLVTGIFWFCRKVDVKQVISDLWKEDLTYAVAEGDTRTSREALIP